MNLKMKSLYKIATILVLFSTAVARAQQDPNYTLYRFAMNLINPGYAGTSEKIDLGINVRSQWANVKGAPQTQSFIFAAPMGKNVGLGVSVISDKTFIEKQTSLALDFSYHLKLSDRYDLFFGLKGSFNSYNANTDGLVTYGVGQDPKLMGLNGRMNPNVGAGVYLKHDDYFVSLSVPKILSADRLEEENGIATLGPNRTHIYIAGGYDFHLGGTTVFKPSLLLKYVNASPLSVDLTAMFEFNNNFDIGPAYRVNESVGGMVLFKASKSLRIGYAYESSLKSSIQNIDNGTHEIMMNLKL